MRIALDAMGGDHGPNPNVAGALQAVSAAEDLTVVLVGDEQQIRPALESQNYPADRIEIHHCSQTVGMDEKPVDAFRKKPDNSIAHCWKLLATKQADGLVSAGNTGAVVAAGLFTKRFLKGIRRPGIAALMPTAKGRCVIMDVGANVFPKAVHLLQYGVMGSVYAKNMLGIESPTIGLINVGEEESKGHELVQKTFELYRTSPLKDRFIGNVEGRDIHRGNCDVIITDGFVGNVLLKHAEGLFEFVMQVAGQSILGALNAEKGLAAAAMKGLIDKFHYSALGGAPLLGIDGVCMICHGSSDERAISNALAAAVQEVRVGLNQKIVEAVAGLPSTDEE